MIDVASWILIVAVGVPLFVAFLLLMAVLFKIEPPGRRRRG